MKVLLKDKDDLLLIVVSEVFFDYEGLNLVDYSGDLILISNIDRDMAEYYIRTLYNNERVDLSEFTYKWIEEDDYEDEIVLIKPKD